MKDVHGHRWKDIEHLICLNMFNFKIMTIIKCDGKDRGK